MAGEPAFFEIGVQDPDRGRAFYGGLLGWAFDATGGGHRITTPGIGGGMHGGDRGAVPWVFFRVDDMEAALERLESLGGSVEGLHEGETETAESIARHGRVRWCRDDQGSAFGLHQRPA